MYIPPNSTIEIFSGVKLDKTYQETIYFANEGAQRTFFNTNAVRSGLLMTIDDSQFIRHTSNTIRVAKNVNSLLTANYMCFFNAGYSNGNNTRPNGKWFYCFVDSVEYVNEDETLLTYTVDVMQTWFVGVNIGSCFIENAHAEKDDKDNYLVGEEPYSADITQCSNLYFDLPTCSYVGIYTTLTRETDDYVKPSLVNGVPVGYTIHPFTAVGGGYGDFVQTAVADNKQDAIIGVYPLFDETISILGDTVSVKKYTNRSLVNTFYNEDSNEANTVDPLSLWGGGYEPLNKKLYTSQFFRIVVTGYDGGITEVKPEYLTGAIMAFIVDTTAYPVPERRYIMSNYGVQGGIKNRSVQVSNLNVPRGTVNASQSEAYFAANKYSIIGSYIRDVASIAVGLSPIGSKMTAVGGAISAVTTTASLIDKSRKPTTLMGGIGAGGIKWNAGSDEFGADVINQGYERGVMFYGARIDDQTAKSFDNYMSRYGYTYNTQMHVPLFYNKKSNRKHFCFYKISNIPCIANIPSDASTEIKNILGAGITFWNNNSYASMGDYSDTIFAQNVPQTTAQIW